MSACGKKRERKIYGREEEGRERERVELKARCCPHIDSDLLTCLPDAFSSFLKKEIVLLLSRLQNYGSYYGTFRHIRQASALSDSKSFSKDSSLLLDL